MSYSRGPVYVQRSLNVEWLCLQREHYLQVMHYCLCVLDVWDAFF